MKLKEWRKSKGLTQAQLADRLHVHSQYVSDIERGARTVGGNLARAILQLSEGEVTPNDLLIRCDRQSDREAA